MELRQEEFDVIMIIGNGFDLNLGLKTAYSDFIESFFFESLLTKGNKLCLHLNGIHSLQKWIDIENEFKEYSRIVESDNDSDFFNEYKELTSSLKQYLNTISYENLDKNSRAYKLIAKIKDYRVLIIDFNYTFSVKNICKELGFELNNTTSKFECLKIHGSIEENDSIIFGIEDGARIVNKHVFLKKSVNKNFNTTDFSNEIYNNKNFIVFGHSLGETDHMYFKDYFVKTISQVNNKVKQHVTVHYYGEESYYDLFAQIDSLTLNNISKFKHNSDFKTVDTKNYG